MLIEEKKKMPKYLQIFLAGLRCYGSEKMVAKVKKDFRHPWNFSGAWKLMSRAEQPWPRVEGGRGGGGKCPRPITKKLLTIVK